MRTFVLVLNEGLGTANIQTFVTLHRTIGGALRQARESGFPLEFWRNNARRENADGAVKVYHDRYKAGFILHLQTSD